MKKTFSFCLIFFLLMSLTSISGLGQTAGEILENMIEAGGGRKLLEKINDTTMIGTVELIQYGMNGTLTIYQKEPNKTRFDFDIGGIVLTQAFDGKTGWETNPQTGEAEKMSDLETEFIRRDAYGNAALLDPDRFGITYSLKGEENIEGKDYFILEQVHSDGYKAVLYIDSKAYFIYKVKAKTLGEGGKEVESETFLSDYKEVDGIMLAHSAVVFLDGAEYMNLTTTEVIFNSKLEDSLFKMEE